MMAPEQLVACTCGLDKSVGTHVAADNPMARHAPGCEVMLDYERRRRMLELRAVLEAIIVDGYTVPVTKAPAPAPATSALVAYEELTPDRCQSRYEDRTSNWGQWTKHRCRRDLNHGGRHISATKESTTWRTNE